MARLSPAERQLVADYSRASRGWQAGPGVIYDALAEVVVRGSPVPLSGRVILDVGAGTGAASRAIRRAGGTPIALDMAWGMAAAAGGPAVVGDARALPLGARVVDGVMAAFSFNHLPHPESAFLEAARVVAPGGFVLASAYADDDDHPVKRAVQRAATEAGWVPPPWVPGLRQRAIPRLASPERAVAAAARAGLAASARKVEVPLALRPGGLVSWRLGMADLAPFVASLGPSARHRLRSRALDLLGTPPALVRRVVVLVAEVP